MNREDLRELVIEGAVDVLRFDSRACGDAWIAGLAYAGNDALRVAGPVPLGSAGAQPAWGVLVWNRETAPELGEALGSVDSPDLMREVEDIASSPTSAS